MGLLLFRHFLFMLDRALTLLALNTYFYPPVNPVHVG